MLVLIHDSLGMDPSKCSLSSFFLGPTSVTQETADKYEK